MSAWPCVSVLGPEGGQDTVFATATDPFLSLTQSVMMAKNSSGCQLESWHSIANGMDDAVAFGNIGRRSLDRDAASIYNEEWPMLHGTLSHPCTYMKCFVLAPLLEC